MSNNPFDFHDETPDIESIAVIEDSLFFGHGPVLGVKSHELEDHHLDKLDHEELNKLNQGWHFEFEKVVIESDDGTAPGAIDVKYKIPPIPSEAIYQEMWNTLDSYEADAWSDSNIGLKSGWDTLDNAFDGGIKPGFIMIGGDSNLGKSAVISQLATQIALLNDSAFVMDFSLDDPLRDKLPRIVGCMNKVPLNAVRNPKQFKTMQLMLARRKAGMLKLRSMVKQYKAYDATFSTYVEDIEAELVRVQQEFFILGEQKHIVVFIDNFHDLTVKSVSFKSDKEKYDYIGQWCSDLAIRHNIPVICSGELKKINGSKRPDIDDLRESVKIKYESKAVILVYNEVHYKAEGAFIYFNRSDKTTKQPVLEMHFAKNKFSSYKGRLFFEFFPEMARLEEPDEATRKTYANTLFGGV